MAVSILAGLSGTAGAAGKDFKRAQGTIDAAIAATRKASPDCQTVLLGNLDQARRLVDGLKVDPTPDKIKQAMDWINNTALAGSLGGCPADLIDRIRGAASQVADGGAEEREARREAAPAPAAGASSCTGISELARDWDALGAYLDDHEDDGLDGAEVSFVAREEKRLVQRSVPLIRSALAASVKFRKLGQKLLTLLLQLDGVDDDNEWTTDSVIMGKIVKNLDRINAECASYFN